MTEIGIHEATLGTHDGIKENPVVQPGLSGRPIEMTCHENLDGHGVPIAANATPSNYSTQCYLSTSLSEIHCNRPVCIAAGAESD